MHRSLVVIPAVTVALLVLGAAPAGAKSLEVKKPCGCVAHEGPAGYGPVPNTPSGVTTFS